MMNKKTYCFVNVKATKSQQLLENYILQACVIRLPGNFIYIISMYVKCVI